MAAVPQELAEKVRRRARGRCEYCRLPEHGTRAPFEVEHVISKQHRGLTEVSNLAWCCLFCNRHKRPNVAGYDPETEILVRLFNPRQDSWPRHFALRKASIVGRMDVGRTTVDVLKMNNERMVLLRLQLIGLGLW